MVQIITLMTYDMTLNKLASTVDKIFVTYNQGVSLLHTTSKSDNTDTQDQEKSLLDLQKQI